MTKLLAKERGIKGYESMSEDKLFSTNKASESENNFDKTIREKIREELKKLQHKFSKSKIKKIIKKIYEIENERNLSGPKIKETEKYLLRLEKSLFKLKKYCDKDKYKGTRSIINLFDLL